MTAVDIIFMVLVPAIGVVCMFVGISLSYKSKYKQPLFYGFVGSFVIYYSWCIKIAIQLWK